MKLSDWPSFLLGPRRYLSIGASSLIEAFEAAFRGPPASKKKWWLALIYSDVTTCPGRW